MKPLFRSNDKGSVLEWAGNTYLKLFKFNQYYRDLWVSEKAAEIEDGAKVLDAGVGKGRYRHLFRNCDYKTQDFCQEPSTINHYTQMDYVCDITNIPVFDESFDVVICTEVLEHIPEPIEALKELSRILSSGGKLLITAPLGCGLHQEPYIYHGGFTPFWYERFLPQFGFEELKIIPNRGFFMHYGQESLRFLTYVFPKSMSLAAKIFFYPVKVVLVLWFGLIIPVSCHFLDRFDKDRRFTVGYFVEAHKK